MSTFIPEGVLPPARVVTDYEDKYGRVPASGAVPGNVWKLITSYGFEVYYPGWQSGGQEFGWSLDMIKATVDWVPLMIPYWNAWDGEGNGIRAHSVTLFAVENGRYKLWDQNAGQVLDWSEDDLYWTRVRWNGEWVLRAQWTGWAIAAIPYQWGDPAEW